MRKISTVLRQWCKTCQASTPSRTCVRCTDPGTACATCKTCTIHGKLTRAEIGK